eukprot:11976201-Alexandrium_andersonii.AAC.1
MFPIGRATACLCPARKTYWGRSGLENLGFGEPGPSPRMSDAPDKGGALRLRLPPERRRRRVLEPRHRQRRPRQRLQQRA